MPRQPPRPQPPGSGRFASLVLVDELSVEPLAVARALVDYITIHHNGEVDGSNLGHFYALNTGYRECIRAQSRNGRSGIREFCNLDDVSTVLEYVQVPGAPGVLRPRQSAARVPAPTPAPPPAPAPAPTAAPAPVAPIAPRILNLAELNQATDGFSDRRIIGRGGFGPVYRGTLGDGREVAVKRLEALNAAGRQQFDREIQVLGQCAHANIVRLLAIVMAPPCLVYPYMTNADLKAMLATRPELSAAVRVSIALDVASGLDYLHTPRGTKPEIVHRDVKSANVLLDGGMRARVADAGMARDTSDDSTMTQGVGTPGYLDPEYVETYSFTASSDIFSFGVVLLELLTSLPPIDRAIRPPPLWLRMSAIGRAAAAAASRAGWTDDVAAEMGDIARRCVARAGVERPQMAAILAGLERVQRGAAPPPPPLARLRECVVCMDEPRTTQFQPCLHSVCCVVCAASLVGRDAPCPNCRSAITGFDIGDYDETYAPPPPPVDGGERRPAAALAPRADSAARIARVEEEGRRASDLAARAERRRAAALAAREAEAELSAEVDAERRRASDFAAQVAEMTRIVQLDAERIRAERTRAADLAAQAAEAERTRAADLAAQAAEAERTRAADLADQEAEKARIAQLQAARVQAAALAAQAAEAERAERRRAAKEARRLAQEAKQAAAERTEALVAALDCSDPAAAAESLKALTAAGVESASACKAVVQAMTTHRDSEIVAIEGCRAVAQLSSSQRNKKRLANAGACEAVVDSLRRHSGCAEQCCLIAERHSVLKPFVDAGVVEVVVAALAPPPRSAEVAQWCLRILNEASRVADSAALLADDAAVYEAVSAVLETHPGVEAPTFFRRSQEARARAAADEAKKAADDERKRLAAAEAAARKTAEDERQRAAAAELAEAQVIEAKRRQRAAAAKLAEAQVTEAERALRTEAKLVANAKKRNDEHATVIRDHHLRQVRALERPAAKKKAEMEMLTAHAALKRLGVEAEVEQYLSEAFARRDPTIVLGLQARAGRDKYGPEVEAMLRHNLTLVDALAAAVETGAVEALEATYTVMRDVDGLSWVRSDDVLRVMNAIKRIPKASRPFLLPKKLGRDLQRALRRAIDTSKKPEGKKRCQAIAAALVMYPWEMRSLDCLLDGGEWMIPQDDAWSGLTAPWKGGKEGHGLGLTIDELVVLMEYVLTHKNCTDMTYLKAARAQQESEGAVRRGRHLVALLSSPGRSQPANGCMLCREPVKRRRCKCKMQACEACLRPGTLLCPDCQQPW